MQPLERPRVTPAPPGEEVVDGRLVAGYLWSALTWLIVSGAVGLVIALKLNLPDFLGHTPWLSYGRLRLIHVNGMALLWWLTAAMGLVFYVVPRLCGVRLYGAGLARAALWIWNGLGIASVVTLALGLNKGLELAEMIWPINVAVTAVALAWTVCVLGTVFTRREPQLYVSLWYIVAGVIWTDLNYVLGNFILPALLSGVDSANVHGFYLHNVVGLTVTPLGLGLAYYFIPTSFRNPLHSHALSLIGFWTIAMLYPFTGAHHYIFSPIVNWVQTVAIATSVSLLVPVWTVVYNLFATMHGQGRRYAGDVVPKFLVMGLVFYLLTCIQGATQSLRSMQSIIHFTDWVIGHSHLALFGCFSLWAFAGMYAVWPRITGRALYSQKMAHWHFWLSVAGFSMMALSLWAAGLIEGVLWMLPKVDFMASVTAVKPYWIIRTVSGGAMFAGFVVFAYNLFMTARRGEPIAAAEAAA